MILYCSGGRKELGVTETQEAGIEPSAAGRRWDVLLATAVAAIPLALLVYRFHWLVDDAFISFRYVRHLAEGHALRFNIGESPPVEGYSNFLWVLVLAPFHKMGWEAPLVSRVISVACGFVLLWRTVRFVGVRMELDRVRLIVVAVFLATLPPLAVWSTSGLATMPHALLAFLAFEFVVAAPGGPRPIAGSLVCVLLILIRVDGMVWAAGFLALAGWIVLFQRGREGLGNWLVCAGVSFATVAGLTVFRLAYFGLPLANTAYVKVGVSAMTLERGFKYVLNFVLTFPHVLAMIVAGAVLVERLRGRGSLGSWVFLIVLGHLAYPVMVGGDWMAMGRLLVPVTPFLALLFGLVLHRMVRQGSPTFGVALGAIALSLLPAWNLHVVPQGVRELAVFHRGFEMSSEYERWQRERRQVGERTKFALAIREHTEPGESMIAMSIGAFGYYTELFLYDLNGLVTPEVAHRDAPRRRLPSGHDKCVPREFFLKDRPTYYEAMYLKIGEGPRLSADRPNRLGWDRPFDFDRPAEVRAEYLPVGYLLSRDEGTGKRQLLVLITRKDVYAEKLLGS